MASYGIEAEDLPYILGHQAFPKACETLADVAGRHFGQAAAAVAECNRDRIRPAIMMMEIYRRIFSQLKQRGWRHLNLPVGLSKINKLWVALRYGLF